MHSLAGWVSLAAILVVGPRLGRYSRKRQQHQMTRSDIPLASLGLFILWFGWFGFNGGSTLAFDHRVPGVLLNTLFGGCAGMTVVLLWLVGRQRVIAAERVLNSSLAGLVAVTAGCHAFSSRDAILVGAIGGLVMLAAEHWLARWRIDDAVGAIPVHLGAGIWGTLAVGFFGDPGRLGTGLTRVAQIQAQLSGIVAVAVWSFATGLVALYLVSKMTPLRVTRKQEYMGLNITEHGEQSELQDLHDTMRSHAQRGNLQRRAQVNPFTEVGQISNWYNQVVQSLEVAIAQTDAIITTAVDGIMTVYPESLVIRSVNPAIAALFGEDNAAIVGRSLTDFISFDFYAEGRRSPDRSAGSNVNASVQLEDSRAAMQLYSLIAAACQRGNVQEAQGFHGQGRIFPIEVTATESIAGHESFWTLMIRDATERKAAQTALQNSESLARETAEQLKQTITQLKQAQAQLMQSEKMSGLGQLVAGITHEINNPIGFIYSNLEHAQQYVQELLSAIEHYEVHATQDVHGAIADLDVAFIREDFPRLIGSMQTGSERIRNLIESLKTFARFDESAWKRADLQEGLDSALIMLGHRLKGDAQRPAIEVVKRYGNLPSIDCYASALNQVFLSLLSNAIEALAECSSSQNPGQIIIATELQDDHVVIAIADNGPGIAPDLQSKIFDPFFTTKPIGQGTGMGLAISHQIIVEQHGGSLTCQSDLGAGTTFVIAIPQQPMMLHRG